MRWLWERSDDLPQYDSFRRRHPAQTTSSVRSIYVANHSSSGYRYSPIPILALRTLLAGSWSLVDTGVVRKLTTASAAAIARLRARYPTNKQTNKQTNTNSPTKTTTPTAICRARPWIGPAPANARIANLALPAIRASAINEPRNQNPVRQLSLLDREPSQFTVHSHRYCRPHLYGEAKDSRKLQTTPCCLSPQISLRGLALRNPPILNSSGSNSP
jgi:hypothetical protein